MKRTAGFRAPQLVGRTLARALLCLAVNAYIPLDAAVANTSPLSLEPTLSPPQGVLVVYSERYVIEDDGVLVFHRRLVEIYTDYGQLVGSYAPIGDAPIRLDVPLGNYLVVSRRQGALQKVRASVKKGGETIVPEPLPESLLCICPSSLET